MIKVYQGKKTWRRREIVRTCKQVVASLRPVLDHCALISLSDELCSSLFVVALVCVCINMCVHIHTNISQQTLGCTGQLAEKTILC